MSSELFSLELYSYCRFDVTSGGKFLEKIYEVFGQEVFEAKSDNFTILTQLL